MNIQDLINTDVEFGVSEPADFYIENGPGPYRGKISKIEADSATILLTPQLFYHGSAFAKVTALPRHIGETFSELDTSKVLLANLVVNLPSITHLIGGIRLRKCKN
jgi:hypothetical protein